MSYFLIFFLVSMCFHPFLYLSRNIFPVVELRDLKEVDADLSLVLSYFLLPQSRRTAVSMRPFFPL